MAKIVFKRTSNQINVNTSSDDVENVNVQKDRKVSVNKTAEDQLDNVQIQQEEQLRVTFGPPTSGPVYIVGSPGPQGPTGPRGNYFYSNTAPGNEAITGDRWFHPPSGLEFTKLQGVWIQLYRNINK